MSAVISPCGRYRYALQREINPYLDRHFKSHRILWVMLNPSTADAETDDPTITRCINYSKAWGFNTMDVANLYAFRSTDPSVIKDMAEAASVGVKNDSYLASQAFHADLILCAWGTKAGRKRAEYVVDLLRGNGALHVLAMTKDGHPHHPLYLPKGLKPMPWFPRL